MQTRVDKAADNNARVTPAQATEKQGSDGFAAPFLDSRANVAIPFSDSRSDVAVQRALQSSAHNNTAAASSSALQQVANDSVQAKHARQLHAIIQGNSASPIQKQENKTGLPDNLKSGMEHLSGMSLDHVKVHYNSAKPAAVQAHAYAQGSDIHVASGQEQHLPHELGHVVQQMQGRVQPTTHVSGMQVNDDPGLESEATVMGEAALQRAAIKTPANDGHSENSSRLPGSQLIQCEFSAAGRAYQDHIRDQDTPTWGGYVEAHAIASARGFQTRVFQVADGNLRLIDQVGAGDVRNLSLLWHNDHYMVLNGDNALDGQAYNAGLVLHDPNPDGNCMYEAMFCIMRMGTAHIRGQLQNDTYRKNAVANMRGVAADSIDPVLANMMGEDLQEEGHGSEESASLGDQLKTNEIAKYIMMFYKNYPPKTHYVSEEKKKNYFKQRSDDARVGDDINTILVREFKLAGQRELKDAVFAYLSKDRSYRYVKKMSAEEDLTPFVSLDADEANGLYRVVRSSAAKKIRLASGEKDFTDYSGGKSVADAVTEAIDGLDLSGSISFKHSRHDFQPSGSASLNLQVQLGGSRNYRVGKGDTSSTLVVIDAGLYEENNRWRQIIQAAHRLSFANSEKIEILPSKKK